MSWPQYFDEHLQLFDVWEGLSCAISEGLGGKTFSEHSRMLFSPQNTHFLWYRGTTGKVLKVSTLLLSIDIHK